MPISLFLSQPQFPIVFVMLHQVFNRLMALTTCRPAYANHSKRLPMVVPAVLSIRISNRVDRIAMQLWILLFRIITAVLSIDHLVLHHLVQ